MCSPQAYAIASTGASLFSQGRNQKAMEKYQGELYAANKQSADENAVLSYQQIQQRQMQEGEKASQAINAAHEQATLASGRLVTSMAESNVAGNTAAALLDDFKRKEADYIQTTIRNKAFLEDQLKIEMQSVEYRRRAQIMQGMSPDAPGPNYLNSGIQLGAQLLSIDWNQTHKQNPYAGI